MITDGAVLNVSFELYDKNNMEWKVAKHGIQQNDTIINNIHRTRLSASEVIQMYIE